MKISGVTSINNYLDKVAEANKNSNKKRQNHRADNTNNSQAIITRGQKDDIKVTYQKPTTKPDMATIERLKEESDRAYGQLRELVRQLLEKQGLTFKDLEGLETTVKIDDETRLKAQELIGEGGPLSPEKVSDRIVEFAIAISGGDKSKIDMLRSAITKGFEKAASILGGQLPEISQRTYELINKKLDAWLEG